MNQTDDYRQAQYWEADHGFRPYDHPIVRFFATQRLDFLSRWLDLGQIGSALDVGCGDGFSNYYVAQRVPVVWGGDRSWAMLRRNPSGRLLAFDGYHLPFADAAFDLVYAWDILHHIADPVVVACEMARVSRHYVLLIEPNRDNPAQLGFALIDREHRWVLRYSLSYLRTIARRAGLEIVRLGVGGWIFPNKTPPWLFAVLRHLPYRLPGLGISNWVLARK
jgi:SAM-dependent methyltransferase